MVGLYETALDELSRTIQVDGKDVRPKIIASRRRVRRARSADRPVQSSDVAVFPATGPTSRFVLCMRTHSTSEKTARKYVGIGGSRGAAQGHHVAVVSGPLLATSQKAYEGMQRQEPIPTG